MPGFSLRVGALGALTVLTLGGCSDLRDLFSAHADTAAEAGDMTLSTERLATILASAKRPQPVSREAGEFVAGTWVEYALFARAVARGELPTDSASVAEAVWPEMAELRGTHFHDSLVAQRGALSDREIDSLYRSADVRVLQHILFGAKSDAPADARSATRRKAEAALAQAKRGANFGALAGRLSEDASSKADSGYQPPSPRGRFVPAFDSVGWSLAPGQVSGLVETQFGFHIIRRPPLSDARSRLATYLQNRAGAQLDSMFMDSLAIARDIQVLSDAPATMREAWASPGEHVNSDKVLVRFTGGGLTVQEFLRWARALPPHLTAQIRQTNDSMLGQFARVLTQNVLLLDTADSAGIKVTPEEWTGLRTRYLSQLDTLKAEMELTVPDLTDSTVAASERERIAQLKLEKYFDGVIERKVRLRPLPSALAGVLREKAPHRIDDAGLNRAVAMAEERRKEADTTSVQGAMQRAPGPAPVPGGAQPPAGSRPAPQDSVKQQGSAERK